MDKFLDKIGLDEKDYAAILINLAINLAYILINDKLRFLTSQFITVVGEEPYNYVRFSLSIIISSIILSVFTIIIILIFKIALYILKLLGLKNQTVIYAFKMVPRVISVGIVLGVFASYIMGLIFK